MKIFVTGGTGVLGQPVIRLLKERGHEVHVLSRSAANRQVLHARGAAPVSCDLYNVERLLPHLEGCDAVLHLATRIPKTAELKSAGAWADNDRLRREATAALVDAALEARTVKSFIYPSVFFMYTDRGDSWQSAGDATLDPPQPLRSTLAAERSVARFAAESDGHRGIFLRFGIFYGPTSRDSRDMISMARRGVTLPLAPPDAYKSMIWIEDAAAAVVAALERAPSGVFDVAEDQPMTQAAARVALARAAGRAQVIALPRGLLRFVLPAEMRGLVARSQRVRSTRFRDVTNWSPEVPNQDVGWARIAAEVPQTRRSPRRFGGLRRCFSFGKSAG